MFAILLIALCLVTAHAYHNDPYYACPAESQAAKQFRMMTTTAEPQEVPTMEQAERDMQKAPKEIRELVNNSVSKALTYRKQFNLLIRPFVYRCCDKPFYKCSHVDIPLRFIWYRSSPYYYYYSNYFCFVIYPAGEQTIHYTKCTCKTCVRDCYCPIVGRCVETDYTYHYIIVYCPKLYYYSRYKILLVAVPKDCKCMTYCPNNYYGYSYGYRAGSVTSASVAASQSSSPGVEISDGSRDSSEDDTTGAPPPVPPA